MIAQGQAARRAAAATIFLVSLATASLVIQSSGPHGRGGFPLDDAWIHLVYGRSVARAGYLAYNDGIPATGSTSPLWAYLLGFVHLLLGSGSGVCLGAKITGILLHGFMAVLMFQLLVRTTSLFWLALAAGLLIGASPPLIVASLSGMEVSLACLLGVAGALFYFEKRFWLCGMAMGLAGLARPEFSVVIAVIGLDALLEALSNKVGARRLIALALPVLICGALYIGWDFLIDSRAFPATFYVKAVHGGGLDLAGNLWPGIRIISGNAPLSGGILALGIIALFLAKREVRRPALVMLEAGLSYVVGSTFLIPPADPEAFYYIRYLLPSVPLLFAG